MNTLYHLGQIIEGGMKGKDSIAIALGHPEEKGNNKWYKLTPTNNPGINVEIITMTGTEMPCGRTVENFFDPKTEQFTMRDAETKGMRKAVRPSYFIIKNMEKGKVKNYKCFGLFQCISVKKHEVVWQRIANDLLTQETF